MVNQFITDIEFLPDLEEVYEFENGSVYIGTWKNG